MLNPIVKTFLFFLFLLILGCAGDDKNDHTIVNLKIQFPNGELASENYLGLIYTLNISIHGRNDFTYNKTVKVNEKGPIRIEVPKGGPYEINIDALTIENEIVFTSDSGVDTAQNTFSVPHINGNVEINLHPTWHTVDLVYSYGPNKNIEKNGEPRDIYVLRQLRSNIDNDKTYILIEKFENCDLSLNVTNKECIQSETTSTILDLPFEIDGMWSGDGFFIFKDSGGSASWLAIDNEDKPWGDKKLNDLNYPLPVVDMDANSKNIVALLEDGTVWERQFSREGDVGRISEAVSVSQRYDELKDCIDVSAAPGEGGGAIVLSGMVYLWDENEILGTRDIKVPVEIASARWKNLADYYVIENSSGELFFFMEGIESEPRKINKIPDNQIKKAFWTPYSIRALTWNGELYEIKEPFYEGSLIESDIQRAWSLFNQSSERLFLRSQNDDVLVLDYLMDKNINLAQRQLTRNYEIRGAPGFEILPNIDLSPELVCKPINSSAIVTKLIDYPYLPILANIDNYGYYALRYENNDFFEYLTINANSEATPRVYIDYSYNNNCEELKLTLATSCINEGDMFYYHYDYGFYETFDATPPNNISSTFQIKIPMPIPNSTYKFNFVGCNNETIEEMLWPHPQCSQCFQDGCIDIIQSIPKL